MAARPVLFPSPKSKPWRAEEARTKWRTVHRFLKELSGLCQPFGLVAAGWHTDKRQWHSLAEMMELTQTPAGRSWLERCSLRIYTCEDYLARWRRYLADRMGFAHIPGDSDEGDATVPSATVGSAAAPHLWMRRAGMTDQELANRVGVSRSYVSRQRSGRAKWSPGFQPKVDRVILELEASSSDEKVEGSVPWQQAGMCSARPSRTHGARAWIEVWIGRLNNYQ